MSVLNRLEIDVMQASELMESAQLASKYKLPALVIHPGLASEGHIARGRVAGRYKIITPVDWPKGDNFGMTKMHGLSIDAIEADGFEIMLTPNKSPNDTQNEARAITDFIRRHVSEIVEIRFVLGASIADMLLGLKTIRTPAMVRNDINTKAQISKANPEVHNTTVNTIRGAAHYPIKICGNIIDIRTMSECDNSISRFGVSLLQAKTIIKEFHQQPEDVKVLLQSDQIPQTNQE